MRQWQAAFFGRWGQILFWTLAALGVWYLVGAGTGGARWWWPFEPSHLGFWFLMQLISGTVTSALAEEAGGVAWWAHVGGVMVDMVLVLPLRWRRRRLPQRWIEYAPW